MHTYQGPAFHNGLARILPHVETEIVRRSDHVKGFTVLPKRWIVERTIAWLNRCRRLAKDWENLNRKGLAFLRLASIRLMLRNFVIPLDVPGQTLGVDDATDVEPVGMPGVDFFRRRPVIVGPGCLFSPEPAVRTRWSDATEN
jgi:DDE family transposase